MSRSPKRTIEEAEAVLSCDDNRVKVYRFLEKFSQCEVYVRPYLLKYYKESNQTVCLEEIPLDSREIKTALSEAGIYFEDSKLITKIFGAEDAPGKSSCRWLRNKITHELMIRSIREVCNRSSELMSDMDCFMNTIFEQS